jgi:hypothetical protein
MGFVEPEEDVYLKNQTIISMPEVQKWYNSFNESKSPDNYLYYYTGSSYSTINDSLRKLIVDKKLTSNDFSPSENHNPNNLIEYFVKSAPRLSQGIWVYRNSQTPDVEKYQLGDDYIDAAFLSTSIRSSMTYGDCGNTRLKIYLPKGTRCFPILDKSMHSSENEIVLPAMSILRIIEIEDGNKNPCAMGNHRRFVCTMIGSAIESLAEGIKNEVILEQTLPKSKKNVVDNKDKSDYDNSESKWSSPISSYGESSFIKGMINLGKLNIKK